MLPKPVDEAGKIGYNNIDVRNHLIYFNLNYILQEFLSIQNFYLIIITSIRKSPIIQPY